MRQQSTIGPQRKQRPQLAGAFPGFFRKPFIIQADQTSEVS
jgi:hypothetical protein